MVFEKGDKEERMVVVRPYDSGGSRSLYLHSLWKSDEFRNFWLPHFSSMGFEFVRSREWQELYNQNGAAQPCHPTQIYEMLYCLVALITSWLMYYKFHLQKQIGLITGVSLIIFFGSRFGLEFMKNPQVAEEVNMTLNIGQLLSLPLILLGIYLIVTSKKRKEAF